MEKSVVRRVDNNIYVDNARIGFRNFEGREGQYNAAGNKHFSIFIDEGIAKELEAEGWNIKWPKPSNNPEEDDRQPFFEVNVRFDKYPPKCIMIAGENVTRLDETTVGELDYARFVKIDIILNPSKWEVRGQRGIKPYLKAIYATVETDEYLERYGY